MHKTTMFLDSNNCFQKLGVQLFERIILYTVAGL